MKKYKIFRAWQNQNKKYTAFISSVLTEVISLQMQCGNEIELITYPAQDETGSPDIVGKIWEHIFSCDIFVGDLTKISEQDTLHISNGNVMYESGIADALLGSNRVILLCSEDTDPSKLAFDINHKRISKVDSSNKSLAVKNLNDWISKALEKSDEQTFQRRYMSAELNKKLFVLYNNFFRFLFSNDYSYSEGLIPPSYQRAEQLLESAEWTQLMIESNYSSVLEFIQKQITLSHINFDKGKLARLIDIYNCLLDYQKIKDLTSDELYEKQDGLKSYLLQDARNYKLNTLEDFDESKDTPLFQKDIFYICGSNSYENVFLKECINEESYKRCHYQLVPQGDGMVSCINTEFYKLKANNHAIFSKKIVDILSAIYIYMTAEKYQPTQVFGGCDINSIICWTTQ